MQNNKLEEQITEIETEIKNMNTNKMSFGQMVNKYNDMNKRIHKSLETLKTYYDKIQTIQDQTSSETSTDSQENNININELNEEIFMDLINELNQLKQNITENTSVDDLIKLYMNAQERIKLCDRYLHKQKLEIIKLTT